MPHSSPDLALQMETEDLMTKAHPGCLLWLSLSVMLLNLRDCVNPWWRFLTGRPHKWLSGWPLFLRAHQQISIKEANEIFVLIKCNAYNSVFYHSFSPLLLPLQRRQCSCEKLSLSVSHARTAGHVCGSLAALATGDCRGFQVVSLKGPILGLPHHKCFCLILRGLLSPGEFYFPLCCQDPDFGILAPNSPSNTAPTILCNDQHSWDMAAYCPACISHQTAILGASLRKPSGHPGQTSCISLLTFFFFPAQQVNNQELLLPCMSSLARQSLFSEEEGNYCLYVWETSWESWQSFSPGGEHMRCSWNEGTG